MALSLAVAGSYALERVLWLNGAVCLGVALAWRSRLRLGSEARGPGWTAAAPLALVVLAAGLFFFVPPSEYVNGGRDPAVYFNAGIRIAQGGSVVIDDPLVRTIPPEYRELFFRPQPPAAAFDSLRFLGFFVVDQDAGTVVGQFPHLYPVWIAIAYDTLGLTGARYVHGLWAVLGVLAVYFAGAFVLGRRAALAGAALLAVHVAQVWFARYFCAEMLVQPLVFAGVLACARAHADGDRFFSPVAAVLLGLSLFAHIPGRRGRRRRGPRRARRAGRRAAPAGVVRRAADRGDGARRGVLRDGAGALPAAVVPGQARPPGDLPGGRRRPRGGDVVRGARPRGGGRRHARLAAARCSSPPSGCFAAYALFVREGGDRNPEIDPYWLHLYTSFYLLPVGLAAALAGWLVVSGQRFWRGSALFIVAATFAVFIFHNARVTPDHFWTARRYVLIILPVSLLLIGAAAFTPVDRLDRRRLPGPGRFTVGVAAHRGRRGARRGPRLDLRAGDAADPAPRGACRDDPLGRSAGRTPGPGRSAAGRAAPARPTCR